MKAIATNVDNEDVDYTNQIIELYQTKNRHEIAQELKLTVRVVTNVLTKQGLSKPLAEEYGPWVILYKHAVATKKPIAELAVELNMGLKMLGNLVGGLSNKKLTSTETTALLGDYAQGLHRYQLAHKYECSPELALRILKKYKVIKSLKDEFAQVVRDYIAVPEPLDVIEKREYMGSGKAHKLFRTLGVSGQLDKQQYVQRQALLDEVVRLNKTGCYTQEEIGTQFKLAGNTICEMLKERGQTTWTKVRTEERRILIIERLKQGDKPIMQLSNELDIDETAIRAVMHEAGLTNKWYEDMRQDQQDRKDLAVEIYNKGELNGKEVADIVKFDRRVVCEVINERVGPLDHERRGKYRTWNQTYFDKIDTPEKAYIVGLWSADGNMHKTTWSITLTEGDEYILTAIGRIILGVDPRLSYRPGRWHVWPDGIRRYSNPSYTLKISRKRLVSQFKALGYTPAKSAHCPFITLAPHLMPSYILGCMDGDGYVLKGKQTGIGFTGSEPFVTGVATYLRSYYNGLWKPRLMRTVWDCSCSAAAVVHALTLDLYKESPLWLKRKRTLLDAFLIRSKLT